MQHPSSSTSLTLMTLMLVLCLGAATTFFVLHRAKVEEKGSAAAGTLIESDDHPYTDLNGDPFTFARYRNQVRVVNVWASWSPYTLDEFPVLERIGSEFAEAGVVVIAINRKEPLERIEAYLKHSNLEVSHLIPVVDLTDAYYRSVEGFAMPETVVYDTAGEIIYRARGVFNETELRGVIEGLIEE